MIFYVILRLRFILQHLAYLEVHWRRDAFTPQANIFEVGLKSYW